LKERLTMAGERKFAWDVPADQHRLRVAGAMIAVANGHRAMELVGEYVEGWGEVPSVLKPQAEEAFLAGDEELAQFLMGRDELPPYS
jgi:hypothetical protein